MEQTVILAAGNGRRMGSDHHGPPKPLLPVGGRPLIEHALAQASAAGCREAVVVLGHGASAVREHLERVHTPLGLRFVYTADPEGPNGISLLAAEPVTATRFFLQMVDHVFVEPVLSRLVAGDLPSGMRLLVDTDPPFLDEDDATKVRISGGRIVAIGKTVTRWDAVDAGYFLLDGRVFDALREAKREEPLSVSAGMQRVAAAGLLEPVHIDGLPWIDVDTPTDWANAEKLAGNSSPTGVQVGVGERE